MNFAHTRWRDYFQSINLLDAQTGLVLVQVLANESRPLVVRPDERLPAIHVIEPVRVINFIADKLEVGAPGELMEGDFIADPPVLNCEAIIGVPQHRLADAMVKRPHAFFTFDD